MQTEAGLAAHGLVDAELATLATLVRAHLDPASSA
jgi:hypothetical protein